MLKAKSVYSPIDRKNDGLRIHTARTRGHGLSSKTYDVWMPSLGPSQSLLKLIQGEQITWSEFERRYKRELFELGPVDRRCGKHYRNHGQKFTLRLIKELARRGRVTVMCTCEEGVPCHTKILKKVIESRRI